MTMQPIIITSDKTDWSLRPMFYLIGKYWPQAPRFLIGGYTAPGFDLPADFYSIGAFSDYPVNKWTNGLIEFLHSIDDEIVLLMMDDYWLNTPANHEKIMLLADYLQAHQNVARLDLSGDRLGASGWTDLETLWSLDDLILSSPQSPYHFSFQAALWRKSLLLDCLVLNESPWESEIYGTERLAQRGYLVIGTKHPPLRYTIAVQKGKVALDGGYQGKDYSVPVNDAVDILERHWIPEGIA